MQNFTADIELQVFDQYYNTMMQHLDHSTVQGMFISGGLVSGSTLDGGAAVFLPGTIKMQQLLQDVRNSIVLNGPKSFRKMINLLRSNTTYCNLANNMEGKCAELKQKQNGDDRSTAADPQQQKQSHLIARAQEHGQQQATVPAAEQLEANSSAIHDNNASQPVEHQTDVTGKQHLQGNNEVNDEVDDDGNQQQQQAAPPQQQQQLQSDPMDDEPFVNDKKMKEEMLHDEYTEKRKAIKPLGNVKTKDGLVQKVAKLEDYKYLIEVVNDVEFWTVICEMEGEIHKCIVCDDFTGVNTTYWYGKWKKVPIVVVQTAKQDGTQFQFGSWFETKKALYYMPQIKYVFGVGVCGAAVDVDSGIEKPRALKGHVVVSTHINGYDHQKKAEHDQNRSYSIDCRQSNFYHHLNETDTKHEWHKGLKFGKILSGSWLIANIEAQKSLLNLYQKDEIAFEMEGVGIAAACQNNKNVECCLVIKGVSDYANRQKNDGWQPAAARNAARYLSDMINKKEFPVGNEP